MTSNDQPPVRGALSNLRVLDLSRVLAGPWCTQNLADLGAEVIKVERPGVGDDTRGWGPPWLKDGEGADTPDSTYYAAANRGKRSITVDIAKPAGRDVILELAREADIFVENYKVGDLKRYGLDYASVSAVNPRIIYCSITGFGQTGPESHKPGYDFIFQGMGGVMSVTGERDDRPGGGPQKVGIAVTDILTGMYSTVAILAAVNHRHVTGQGQYIDMALLDCIVAFGANQASYYLNSGKVPGRLGNAHASVAPYDVYATSDGHLIIAVGNDQQWQRCCTALGRPDLAADERFLRGPSRLANREALVAEVQASLRARSTAEWTAHLEELDVPCGPINNYQQVFENAQVRHRGQRFALPRSDGGTVQLVGSPMALAATPPRCELPPPRLGEHTDAILREMLGRDDAQIAALRAAKVV